MADINVNVQVGHTGYQVFSPPVIVGQPLWNLVQSRSLEVIDDTILSISLDFATPVTAGNILVVACRMGQSQLNPLLTDTQGNAWISDLNANLSDPANVSGTVHTFSVWHALANGRGLTTVNVTYQVPSRARIILLEYSTANQPVSVDIQMWKTSGASRTTALDSGATPTRTAASEVLVALISNVYTYNFTAGTNLAWTERQNPGNACAAMDVAVSSVGTEGAQGTFA